MNKKTTTVADENVEQKDQELEEEFVDENGLPENVEDKQYDLVKSLLEAADYKEDESSRQKIEIKRDGKFLFEFTIRPLSEDEVLQILKYKRAHVGFVSGSNEYNFTCPLDLHCQYNTNQIMAAFGLFTETESPEFREGVKYFENKKTDIFLINLNKSEKDFSPSTMYEDYAINAHLFHWESQSQDREASAKIQRYIHHKDTRNSISLFVREYKRNGSYTAVIFKVIKSVSLMTHQL